MIFADRIITKGRCSLRVVGSDVGSLLKRIIWQPIITVPLSAKLSYITAFPITAG